MWDCTGRMYPWLTPEQKGQSQASLPTNSGSHITHTKINKIWYNGAAQVSSLWTSSGLGPTSKWAQTPTTWGDGLGPAYKADTTSLSGLFRHTDPAKTPPIWDHPTNSNCVTFSHEGNLGVQGNFSTCTCSTNSKNGWQTGIILLLAWT